MQTCLFFTFLFFHPTTYVCTPRKPIFTNLQNLFLHLVRLAPIADPFWGRRNDKNVGTPNGENESRGVPPPEIPTGVPFPGHGARNIGCVQQIRGGRGRFGPLHSIPFSGSLAQRGTCASKQRGQRWNAQRRQRDNSGTHNEDNDHNGQINTPRGRRILELEIIFKLTKTSMLN